MEHARLHPGLEIRLTALAERISLLRQKAGKTDTPEYFEKFCDIEVLERRHKTLEAELAQLNGQGPGFPQDVKAGFETLADHLKGWAEDHIMWIDSGYYPDRRPKPLPGSMPDPWQ